MVTFFIVLAVLVGLGWGYLKFKGRTTLAKVVVVAGILVVVGSIAMPSVVRNTKVSINEYTNENLHGIEFFNVEEASKP